MVNVAEKISIILASHLNLFHTDLVCRAILDDSVSLDDFRKGLLEIADSEQNTDDDEFVPNVFLNV